MATQSDPPNPGAPEQEHHQSAPTPPAASGHGAIVALVLVAILTMALAGYGIYKRNRNDKVLARTTEENAAPSVIALEPKPGAPIDEFVRPGNVTAFTDAPLYARTSGYLVHWYSDIGAHVKKGALLAEIATPELDRQVTQAEADLATAQTNAANSKVQAERYKGLVASDAVSKIDTDNLVAQAAANATAVQSAQANLDRLKQLQGFEKIYAPFDGIITARGVDTGQLINAGSGSELFHIQALQTLRVYSNVPEIYSPAVKHGEKIALTFPEHPGKTFTGTLVRTADAIDPANRTLLVEIDVDNRSGELMPGSLAQVHFKAPAATETFILPVTALIFRSDGLRVATIVNNDKNEPIAKLVPIVIGEDDGATVQVTAGLSARDRVIQDPPDSVIEGEKLYVEPPQPQSQPPQAQQPQGHPQPQAQQPTTGGK